MKHLSLVLVCVSLSSAPLVAHADLIGTSVSGAANINRPNFFDPSYGLVNPGYGNSSGTTTTIGPGVEFELSDLFNKDTADFTGTTLTITDQCFLLCSYNNPINYVFTDAAFAGLNLTFLSDGLGLTGSLNGTTLTLQQAAGTPSAVGTVSSSFGLAPAVAVTPEPSGLVLLGTGALAFAGAVRRRWAYC